LELPSPDLANLLSSPVEEVVPEEKAKEDEEDLTSNTTKQIKLSQLQQDLPVSALKKLTINKSDSNNPTTASLKERISKIKR